MMDIFGKLDNDGAHVYLPSVKWTRGTKIRYEFPGNFILNADGECYEAQKYMECTIIPKAI
jgi:diacylglycerol kinase family enzyme